jgi:hypothetical protein
MLKDDVASLSVILLGRHDRAFPLSIAGKRRSCENVPKADHASSGGPPPVTHGERKVIVILTNAALIDRIPLDGGRIEILQEDRSTVPTHKIVATGARHTSFCTEN